MFLNTISEKATAIYKLTVYATDTLEVNYEREMGYTLLPFSPCTPFRV